MFIKRDRRELDESGNKSELGELKGVSNH